MKIEERKKAVKLRKQGLSYNEISKLLQVSKSSLSNWLKDISYVPNEKTLLKRKMASIRNGQVLHKRKIKRISKIKAIANKEISKINNKELKLLGILAYWTEGSKTQDSLVQFTNSDPDLIKFILKWLREICEVPEEKFRIHLRIHNDLNKNEIEYFWSKTTGISLKQFHKTTWKKSISNGNRHNKLPYGIATITVCDTNLFYKIQGWIEGLIKELKLK